MLESVRDWQGLVEELEKGLAAGESNAEKASYHLRLGRVLDTKFLSGVRALKHFQDAYKLNPGLIESLEAARNVYWALGKLNMVQKLLELELKTVKEGPGASARLIELGDVLCDVADYDKATSTYARAVSLGGDGAEEARGCLVDVQCDSGSWQAHVDDLRELASATDGREQSRLLLRAARVTRRFAPEKSEELFAAAYAADPLEKEIASAYEGFLVEAGSVDALERTQRDILAKAADKSARANFAEVFGARWVTRHQNVDLGTRFLEEAVKLDPTSEAAFQYLREVWGRKGGDWERVLVTAEEAAHADDERSSFLLAQAGVIAWRQLGNLIRAREAFAKLSAFQPEHPQLKAFELQIGEPIKQAVSGSGSLIPPRTNAPTSPPPGMPVGQMTAPPPADYLGSVPVIQQPPTPSDVAPTRMPGPLETGREATPAAPAVTRADSVPPPAAVPEISSNVAPSVAPPPPARRRVGCRSPRRCRAHLSRQARRAHLSHQARRALRANPPATRASPSCARLPTSKKAPSGTTSTSRRSSSSRRRCPTRRRRSATTRRPPTCTSASSPTRRRP